MLPWLQANWKAVAAFAVATAVFSVVSVPLVTVGLPLLATFAVAGFVSGMAGYEVTQLLEGKPISWDEALIQGAIAAVVTVGTVGLGRVLAPVVAPLVRRIAPVVGDAMLPRVVARTSMNAATGAAFGAGAQLVANAVEGRPLDERVRDSAILGAAGGALSGAAAGALDRIMGVGSNPVDDAAPVARLSPTLQTDVVVVEALGWRFHYGRPTGGTFCNFAKKQIVVDPTDTALSRVLGRRTEAAASLTDRLAHEVGHVLDRTSRFVPLGSPRADYVGTNLRGVLDSEGTAVLHENLVNDEVTGNGGPSIGGSTSGEYLRIAHDPELSPEEKRSQLGDLVAGLAPSTEGWFRVLTGRARTYTQVNTELLEQQWDAAHPPAPTDPVPEATAPPQSRGFLGALGGN